MHSLKYAVKAYLCPKPGVSHQGATGLLTCTEKSDERTLQSSSSIKQEYLLTSVDATLRKWVVHLRNGIDRGGKCSDQQNMPGRNTSPMHSDQNVLLVKHMEEKKIYSYLEMRNCFITSML